MTKPGGTLDFNTKTMREARASDAITAAVEAALLKKRAAQAPRQYLGASAIGEACERRIQYDYAGAPTEKPFEGKTLRIFDRGHSFEELARAWLLDAGFNVSSWSKTTGAPHGFSQAGGKFRGHVDGVIIDGPDLSAVGVGYPAIWEHKALGAKGARDVERHGLKKSKPGYYAQVQVYMAYLELTAHPAIFTVTNADDATQLHLLIPFDAEEAQRQTDKAVRIIQATEAGDLLPRAFNSPDFFECRFCGFQKRCWEGAK